MYMNAPRRRYIIPVGAGRCCPFAFAAKWVSFWPEQDAIIDRRHQKLVVEFGPKNPARQAADRRSEERSDCERAKRSQCESLQGHSLLAGLAEGMR